MSSSAESTQMTLGVMTRSRRVSPEERRRQLGTESLPPRGRVRDEREFMPTPEGGEWDAGASPAEGDR